MANNKNITDSLLNTDIAYMGDISYKSSVYQFINANDIISINSLENPVSYSIAKDVFSVLTNTFNYTDTFNNIRDEKTGRGVLSNNLDALAQNDFDDVESLSAVAEDDGLINIIAISDSDEEVNNLNLTNYSLNTTVRYSDSNLYWKYISDSLSSVTAPEDLTEDHFFYFKFIDGDFCNILKHTTTGIKYLTFDTGLSSLVFNTVEDEVYSRFYYSYNSSDSRIFLVIQNEGILGFNGSGELSSLPFNSIINDTSNSFSVDFKNALNLPEEIQNSFAVEYSNKNDIGNTYTVDNMGILSHNYSSILDNNSNYIPLKSNLIYDEENSLITTDNNVFFRQYSSINSGIRGDSGYNNYILSYNTSYYRYDFVPDKQTFFNIPYELNGYQQINIKDCNLLNNGANGGSSPLNSDKFYKKLYEYPDFKNTGNTPHVDNSKYLCSWLWYNPLYPQQSIWLDRYYNPDVVTKLDALAEPAWDRLKNLVSFSRDNELKQQYEVYYNEFDKKSGIFDVESKVTIEKNSLYMYEKIGTESSKSLLAEYFEDVIASEASQTMDYSNTFTLLPENTFNDEEYTLNLVLKNFDLDKNIGNKIIDSQSISLTVDKNFSPYIIAVDNTIINYYDFDYNFIKSLNLSSQIDDVIYTDDYNKFYVDCGGILFTIENLDFISNETDILSSYNISDISYYDGKLYVLDSNTNSVYRLFPELNEIEFIEASDVGHDLLLNLNGTIKTSEGEYIDYGDSDDIYVLSSNQLFYENIATPILSSDNIVDFYVYKNDKIFVLKSNKLLKIDNEYITKVDTEVDLTATYTLSSMNMTRYQRDGEIFEYVDIYDTDGTNLIVKRFDTNLVLKDTLTRTISGNIIKHNPLTYTKYLTPELQFDISLYDIFNYYKRGSVKLSIDKKYVDEDSTVILNIVFSNKYGNITTYCNGQLIDIFKFDNNKYYFSNTLKDNKIFIGASSIDSETTISQEISSGDMISGDYMIEDISIYNRTFDYYDVINYNRIYRGVESAALVIPIKTRSYIEEIAGFYTQNKNLRKSEFGSVHINGTDLTDTMQTDVKNKIDKLFDDTYINLRINQTTFE